MGGSRPGRVLFYRERPGRVLFYRENPVRRGVGGGGGCKNGQKSVSWFIDVP